jgi:hypothetical protein
VVGGDILTGGLGPGLDGGLEKEVSAAEMGSTVGANGSPSQPPSS